MLSEHSINPFRTPAKRNIGVHQARQESHLGAAVLKFAALNLISLDLLHFSSLHSITSFLVVQYKPSIRLTLFFFLLLF